MNPKTRPKRWSPGVIAMSPFVGITFWRPPEHFAPEPERVVADDADVAGGGRHLLFLRSFHHDDFDFNTIPATRIFRVLACFYEGWFYAALETHRGDRLVYSHCGVGL
ncbi:MAG: hypothetical protein IPK53_03380 [bacterium]|nr:hypothetical protein [bacterium]